MSNVTYNRDIIDAARKHIIAHNNQAFYSKVSICAQVVGVISLIICAVAILTMLVGVTSLKIHVYDSQPMSSYVLGVRYYNHDAINKYISRVNFNTWITFWSFMTTIISLVCSIALAFLMHYADGECRRNQKLLYNAKSE